MYGMQVFCIYLSFVTWFSNVVVVCVIWIGLYLFLRPIMFKNKIFELWDLSHQEGITKLPEYFLQNKTENYT